jgi:hypothetical protein
MAAFGLQLYHRRRERILAHHPHDEAQREQQHRPSQRLRREGDPGPVKAYIEPDREEPDQRDKAEHQHEFLVGGRLILLHHRAHPLGEQRRVGFGEPQSADDAEHRNRGKECPRRRPVRRARRHEQQRADRDHPDQVLQQQFRDHHGFPFPYHRAVFGKLAAVANRA